MQTHIHIHTYVSHAGNLRFVGVCCLRLCGLHSYKTSRINKIFPLAHRMRQSGNASGGRTPSGGNSGSSNNSGSGNNSHGSTMPASSRPRGTSVTASSGSSSGRGANNAPMSERQQMALLMQMTNAASPTGIYNRMLWYWWLLLLSTDLLINKFTRLDTHKT